MKIAIIGTRGVPNIYGGFEQYAEFISVGLVKRGYDITVYNPSFHPYAEDSFHGVEIIKKWSPEKQLGGAANFIYDFLCIQDAVKKDFDILMLLGYTSSVPALQFYGKNIKSVILSNMDGIEWKRSKYSSFTQKLIRYFEKETVKRSDFLVSDNAGIQSYYKRDFNRDSFCIAYGTEIPTEFNEAVLQEFNVQKENYYMLLARFEPENNIEMILDAYCKLHTEKPFIAIGNSHNTYGQKLQQKYSGNKNIIFTGPVYDRKKLDSLRCFAKAYFHGHSVGGTNPSLLEAMSSRAFIIAHGNEFNRAVLQENALYFTSVDEAVKRFEETTHFPAEQKQLFIKNNIEILEKQYTWNYILDQHEVMFKEIIQHKG